MDLKVKCKNRPPYADFIEDEVGFDRNGNPIVRIIQNRMTKSCQFDLRLSQPGCQGCRWQTERDPRDGPGV